MNTEKIAQEIIAAEKKETKSYKIPFTLDYSNVMGIKVENPRIILDLSKVSDILEEQFKTKKKKTEIQRGKDNEIIFDLEWLK